MIGWLCGHILDHETPGKLVIDVHGVGYDVDVALPTFFELTSVVEPVGLHIHTVVREDALLLYGFIHKSDRALFRALIKVNGVGPKMAMAILSSISSEAFIHAIQQQQTQALVRLPGVGKKTAERLVVEMKDSIEQLSGTQHTRLGGEASIQNQRDEAISALEALGYKSTEASKVIHQLDDGNLSCEQLIRAGLRVLSQL